MKTDLKHARDGFAISYNQVVKEKKALESKVTGLTIEFILRIFNRRFHPGAPFTVLILALSEPMFT